MPSALTTRARVTYPTGKTLLQGRPWSPSYDTDIRRLWTPQLPLRPKKVETS